MACKCYSDTVSILLYVLLAITGLASALNSNLCYHGIIRINDNFCMGYQIATGATNCSFTVALILVINKVTDFDLHKIYKTVLLAFGAAFNVIVAIDYIGGFARGFYTKYDSMAIVVAILCMATAGIEIAVAVLIHRKN